MPLPQRRYPLYLHISTLFLLLLLLVGCSLGWLAYSRSTRIIEDAIEDTFSRIVRESESQLGRVMAPAQTAISLLADQRVVRANSLAERLESLGFFTRAIESADAATALYVGYDSGDFFLVRKISASDDARALRTPPGTHYLVQSVESLGDGKVGLFIYFDGDLREISREARVEYSAFDPRERTWFRGVRAASGPVRTDPYVFFTTRKLGITLARPTSNPRAVVGIDIRLETLAEVLEQQKLTPGTELALYNAKHLLLAYSDTAHFARWVLARDPANLTTLEALNSDVLTQAASVPLADTVRHRPLAVQAGGRAWHALSVQLPGGEVDPVFLSFAVPDDELLRHARALRTQLLAATVVLLLLAVPLTLWLSRLVAKPLRSLMDEAERIRHFEFTRPIDVRSMVLEVDALGKTMQGMKRTIRRFLDISAAIAAEDDFARLMARLLDEMVAAAEAQAGILLLADAEGGALEATALHQGGVSRVHTGSPRVRLLDGPVLLREVLSQPHTAAQTGTLRRAELARWGDAAAALMAQDETQDAIGVALHNRAHKLVGALILIGGGQGDEAKRSFLSALSGTAAVSLESRELIQAQKDLFEAFIRLIASAIDAKSPYTGGHCARVPELTKMLARAACEADSGPFREFALSADEWEAVHVAAWLHDCGKVTTPEYVVDKATKLETLYDRIHEIRMRFEVLKRDAEIEALRAQLKGADPTATRAALAQALSQLDDEFAFVARCNEGGEAMAEADIARLREIGTRTWQRTLDDRLGVSHEELARKAGADAGALPVAEPLLADKPEHRIRRGPQDRLPEDNPWGFRLDPPELLYDRGELKNLSVPRGTLTAEDRYKINDHIVQTIIMLSRLPFPKHLQKVPEIAGGHHETMDGKGYPKHLTREQMSPLARMMAVADIFEALTAIDRPYKKGKTLSEAIAIMDRMRQAGHIDPDVFELFLRSGIYRHYAERFMAPEYIDVVAVERYLGG